MEGGTGPGVGKGVRRLRLSGRATLPESPRAHQPGSSPSRLLSGCHYTGKLDSISRLNSTSRSSPFTERAGWGWGGYWREGKSGSPANKP